MKIIEVVEEEMKKRANMIEVPAKRIADAIIKFNHAEHVKVELEKFYLQLMQNLTIYQ